MDLHPLSIEVFTFIASAGKKGIRHLFLLQLVSVTSINFSGIGEVVRQVYDE